MVNRCLLAVSLESLQLWTAGSWVELDVQVEDMVAESLRGAKRGEEKSCSERLGGCKELSWQIFVGLIDVSIAFYSQNPPTHKINLSFP